MRQPSPLLVVDVEGLGHRIDNPVLVYALPAVQAQLDLAVTADVGAARGEHFDHQLGGTRQMAGRVEGGEEALGVIRAALAEGRGLIVLTLHLGNWEIGLAYLTRLGSPVTVVLRPEEGPAALFEERARAHPGLRIVAAGESALGGLDLLLALRRGEIVALQGDRALGPACLRIDLFGAPADLPSGPFALAQASGAPILVVAFPIRGHDRYRVEVEGPLRVAAGPEGVARAAAAFARRLEGIVRRYPTQWFNFYDVWDGAPD